MKRTTYKEPKFYLDIRKGQSHAGIFLKYSFGGGERISYYTGQRIEPDKWNNELQRVKRNVTGGADINDALDNLATKAKKAVSNARLLEQPLTKNILKKILDEATGKQQKTTAFFEVLNQFIETETKLKSWTVVTKRRFMTLKNQLHEFEQYQKRGYKISFNTINEDFFIDISNFWQTVRDLRNSTIEKNIRLLFWFLNWCHKKGYTQSNYKNISIDLKKAKPKVIFLDMDEISKLYKLEIPPQKEYLHRIRDIFIFQCLTGLRFSDLHNLKTSDIKNNTLYVSTIKTGEVIEIELNDTTKQIIDKFKDHQSASGKALPVPANPVYNRFLKELARLAGINEKITLVHYKGAERIEQTFEKWQLITTHTARRSFITNGLSLGIGSEVIRSWTGHTNDKSFAVYYEIVKKRKEADIQKFVIE